MCQNQGSSLGHHLAEANRTSSDNLEMLKKATATVRDRIAAGQARQACPAACGWHVVTGSVLLWLGTQHDARIPPVFHA